MRYLKRNRTTTNAVVTLDEIYTALKTEKWKHSHFINSAYNYYYDAENNKSLLKNTNKCTDISVRVEHAVTSTFENLIVVYTSTASRTYSKNSDTYSAIHTSTVGNTIDGFYIENSEDTDYVFSMYDSASMLTDRSRLYKAFYKSNLTDKGINKLFKF